MMRRRELLRTATAAGIAAATAGPFARGQEPGEPGASGGPVRGQESGEKFKLGYAPHPGMFKNLAGDDVIEQIKFSADQGFTAFEYNGLPNETPAMQEKIGETLDSLGMQMGVFLFDIYHQQITEGNLIPNIDQCWDEIAYFQVGDNPGRKEPSTGEINYRNVFRHLHEKGFAGVVGMEHGNSERGEEGERRVIAAYREADDF